VPPHSKAGQMTTSLLYEVAIACEHHWPLTAAWNLRSGAVIQRSPSTDSAFNDRIGVAGKNATADWGQ
jgi:hypothetical protein